MEQKSADEIIQLIAETLTECDDKFIQKIANQVLSSNVIYKNNTFFINS